MTRSSRWGDGLRRTGWVAITVFLTACGPSPEPEAPTQVAPAKASKHSKARGAGHSDAPADADAGAEADATDVGAVYHEPPPIVVRRHYVYCTLRARAGKRATLDSLLTTASDEAPELGPGTEAVLQDKPKGAADWVPAGKVKVVTVSNKGNRAAGTERQEIAVEILSEEPGHKAAFVRLAKLRLEIDRPEEK
jgi:hypothetical protein